MKLLLLLFLLAVRWSGSVSPAGGAAAYAPLEAVDAAALCAAEMADAGVEAEPMGPAWQPGSDQSATCWDPQLGVR